MDQLDRAVSLASPFLAVYIVTCVLSVVAVDCPNPAVPDNGYLLDPYDGGEDVTIQYACHEGYELDGTDENFCVSSSGYWSLTPPECIGKCGMLLVDRSLIVYKGWSEGQMINPAPGA